MLSGEHAGNDPPEAGASPIQTPTARAPFNPRRKSPRCKPLATPFLQGLKPVPLARLITGIFHRVDRSDVWPLDQRRFQRLLC